MSETPFCAYRRVAERGLTAGAGYTMTAVYKHTPQSAVRAYVEQGGAVPFTWVSVETLSKTTGRSRSLTYEDIRALEAAGVLIPARREVSGQTKRGWELPLRDMPTETGSGQSDTSEEGQQRPRDARATPTSHGANVRPAGKLAAEKSGPPDIPTDRTSGPPDEKVRPAGSESPAGRKNLSGRPDENLLINSEENSKKNCAVAEETDRGVRETRVRATPPAAATTRARRPIATIDGEPAGSGLTSARELLRELGLHYCPTDSASRAIETQRIRVNDPAALVLAERLLAVPLEGLSEEDARRARTERFAYVLDVCRRFAEICRRDANKRQWWGPGMLAMTIATGKTKSRWAMIETDVAEDQRAAAETEVRARASAQARAAVRPAAEDETPEQKQERLARVDRMEAEFSKLVGGMRYGAAKVVSGRAVAMTDAEDERVTQQRLQVLRAFQRARELKGRPLSEAQRQRVEAHPYAEEHWQLNDDEEHGADASTGAAT